MRLLLIYSGRVQGVGFRATARDVARSHPVTGWVRNEADGTVAAQVQGSPADVDAFVTDLGRQLSRFITGVHRETLPDVPGEHAFEVQR